MAPTDVSLTTPDAFSRLFNYLPGIAAAKPAREGKHNDHALLMYKYTKGHGLSMHIYNNRSKCAFVCHTNAQENSICSLVYPFVQSTPLRGVEQCRGNKGTKA